MTGRPKNRKNTKPQHMWSKEEIEYLTQITPGKYRKEILKLMNEKFEYQFSLTQIAAAIKRYGLTTGLSGQFGTGAKPWNKGTKGLTSANITSFKKGHTPINYKPVGSERINVEGYIEVKVADPRKWRLKHRVIWEQHHGEIPKGHAIIFADGDKSNLDIDNLLLVSRKQLLFMNRNNLITENKDFTKVGVNIANVMIKLSEIDNKSKN